MKTFKDIVSEVAQPLSGDEKRFKDKHKVNTIGDPQNNGDKLYKGSEIKKDKTKKASYEDGEDTKVYEEVEMDEAKGEDAYYARYGAGGKKKSPEEVASDKKAAAIKKDRESYSKMRKDLGTDDYATTKKIVGEKIDVYAAMKARYGKDFKKKSPEEVAADKEKEKEVKKKSEMSKGLEEKKLTPAEMKKREEVAKAIERENPNMPMGKKMAIATATAKKVAESISEDIKNKIAVYRQDGSYIGLMNNFSDAQQRYPGHVFHSIQTKPVKESEDENIAKVNAIASNLKSMTQPKQTPKLPNVNDGLTGKAKELFTVKEAGETPPSLGSPSTPNRISPPSTPNRISPTSTPNRISPQTKAQKWLRNLKAPYSGHPQGGEEDVPLSWGNTTESYDAEGEMAKTELRAIAHKALQLHSMMEDDDQLESWLQSKITKAKYMIDSVYDYIVYNMPDDEDDEPAEDYMSALPYPNRPVGGGMYSEETGYKYLMTYAKFGSNKERQLTKHIKHTHIMFPEKPTTPERVRYVVANSPEHKKLKVDGYEITHYGEHKKDVTHKNIHKNEPTYAG